MYRVVDFVEVWIGEMESFKRVGGSRIFVWGGRELWDFVHEVAELRCSVGINLGLTLRRLRC